MKKIWYILFIALFFLACLVPTVGMLIAGPSEAAANEIPAAVPRVKNFDGSWNKDFFTNLRDYIGKGFYLRLEGITGSYAFDEYNNPIKSAAMIRLENGEEVFTELF